MNSGINCVVGDTLNKRGYERTRQKCSWLRSSFCQNEKSQNEFEFFYRQLKRNVSKRMIMQDLSDLTNIEETTTVAKKKLPRLSFEVNFDFDDIKVSNKPSVKTKKKVEIPKEKAKEPEEVPEKFLKHVLALGFQEEDAPLLYEHKEQWIGIELDSKIKCTELGCKFETEMYPDCLVDHCKTVHRWRDFPCEYQNCSWVSHSSTSYKQHKDRFHRGRCSTHLPFKCEFVDCGASFRGTTELNRHMNIHKNIGYHCSYCRYSNTLRTAFKTHLNHHFDNRAHKCEFCSKSYVTNGALNQHIESVHDAIQYDCPLCPDKTGNIQVIRDHIRVKHKVKHSFDRKQKQFVIVKETLNDRVLPC